MNWRENSGQILVIILLGLILFWSLGGAEELNSNKTAMVANLEFVGTDLRQVFRFLAQAGGFQTLLDPAVQGVVSIAFHTKSPAKDAAIALAASSGLNFRWLGDSAILYIGNSNPGDAFLQKKENRILPLKFTDPAVAAEALTAVVPKARITVDAKNKQLKISAHELEFQNISEILQDLDRALPKLNIEIRIVELPEGSLKELGLNSMPAPIRMGAFPLTDSQLQMIEGHTQFSNLYRGEIPVSEGQAGQLQLEDHIPTAPENSPDGVPNYQVKNLAVGLKLSVTLHPGRGAKLTLVVRSKTGSITNTNPPIDGAGYTPVPGIRELTSIITWEPGQKIILTGALQRSEFKGLLNIPYQFPILTDLFLGKNVLLPAQNSATQTVIIMIPQIKDAVNPAVTPIPAGAGTDIQTAGSGFTGISKAAEEKDPIKLGPATPTPIRSTLKFPLGTAPKPGSATTNPDSSREVTRVQYIVKKGDTLTRIAAKFGVTVAAIAAENNLESPGTIKINMTLVIPVNSNRIYTIKPKETLWRIAKRYGVSIEELKDLNGIADIEKVEAGQKIVLPIPIFYIINPEY
ncbi:MAG: LysM peptidoglycan-binding domain-containing protein [Firmicutes bacterium]|nr:LysM peptidoglycan-binding domain-containing protein [Bacillota bacterium]